ncbi:hypothetical protein DFH28DRAFT_285620 [Melampsora americana]|nr:hypothetical protein DFH28DRAFT_285620 [Melampsora americana]
MYGYPTSVKVEGTHFSMVQKTSRESTEKRSQTDLPVSRTALELIEAQQRLSKVSLDTSTNKVVEQNQVHNEWWKSSQKGINDDELSLCSSSATTFNSPLFESIARREVELQQSILKEWRTRYPSKKDSTE